MYCVWRAAGERGPKLRAGKHRFLKPTNDYDPCAGIPISRLLSVFNCDLNVKVLVGALNQENVLVGAFSMVDGCET